MKITNILLTTDFSDAARKAYPAAIGIAEKFDAKIHLVHVSESASLLYMGGFGGGVSHADILKDLRRHLAEESKHDIFKGRDLQTHLVTETHIVDGLRHYEKEHGVDFAVISSHGRTGLTYALLGSQAEKIVRGLQSPVLTYRVEGDDGGAFQPQRVLVPFDFSENSRAVLPAVRFLAQTFTPEFTFYFVVEPIYPFFGEGGHASYDLIRQSIEEGPKLAQVKFSELKQEELAGVNATLEFGDGAAATEILEKVKRDQPDLVVMSTHGWTGFRHFFLGSVAETVVRKAPVSVLTVRAPAGKDD